MEQASAHAGPGPSCFPSLGWAPGHLPTVPTRNCCSCHPSWGVGRSAAQSWAWPRGLGGSVITHEYPHPKGHGIR